MKTSMHASLAAALFAAAALASLAMNGCASRPEEPTTSTGRYVDDATVTARVKNQIASDVGVRAASNVNVETYRSVVQLSGSADSDEQASRAVAAAKKVRGVRSVKNDIRVKAGA